MLRCPKHGRRRADRFASSLSGETHQLSALFGDKAMIAKTRAMLADEHAPMGDRRAAFDLLRRSGDPDSVPVYARLLDVPEFRSAVIPLLSGSNDPATASALIERYPKFDAKDRIAALAR